MRQDAAGRSSCPQGNYNPDKASTRLLLRRFARLAREDLRSKIVEAFIAEVMDYFSVPAVSGIALQESEARWIASGVAQRVCPGPFEQKH
jgi:hypothetical protein